MSKLITPTKPTIQALREQLKTRGIMHRIAHKARRNKPLKNWQV